MLFYEGMAGAVNGAKIKSDSPLEVINPATEEVIGVVGVASASDVDRAVAAARKAFDAGAWSNMEAAHRVAVLERMLDWFAARAEEIRSVIMQEAGCPIGSPVMAAQFDGPLKMTRDLMHYYLRLPEFEQNPVPIMDRVSPAGVFIESLKRYVPVGVVTAISAYNFPFFLNIWKVIPALMTGNTVILRPSPLTPYSALIFADAAEAAGLPQGILNIVIDAGQEGGVTLTTDRRVC